MSDGVNIKDAAGNTVPMATDDTPVGQVQLVKLDLGGNGENDVAQGAVPVLGPLTDEQLRATPLPVTGPFYQATQPVSAVSLPLPAGAATAAGVAALTKPSDSQHATLDDVAMELRRMLQAINYPGWLDRSANQIRAQVTGSATVSGSLTTLSNLGSFPGDFLMRQSNFAAWQLIVRSRIS